MEITVCFFSSLETLSTNAFVLSLMLPFGIFCKFNIFFKWKALDLLTFSNTLWHTCTSILMSIHLDKKHIKMSSYPHKPTQKHYNHKHVYKNKWTRTCNSIQAQAAKGVFQTTTDPLPHTTLLQTTQPNNCQMLSDANYQQFIKFVVTISKDYHFFHYYWHIYL